METIALPQPKAIPFRQERKYGCPVYCLANLLNDDRILQELDEMKPTGMYSFWIYKLFKRHLDRHFNLSMIVEPLFCLPPKIGKLEDMGVFAIEYLPEEAAMFESGNLLRVFLAGVHFGDPSKTHCVLLFHDMVNQLFFVVDPLTEIVKKYEETSLLSSIIIYQLDTFISEEREATVFFYRNYLSHLFE